MDIKQAFGIGYTLIVGRNSMDVDYESDEHEEGHLSEEDAELYSRLPRLEGAGGDELAPRIVEAQPTARPLHRRNDWMIAKDSACQARRESEVILSVFRA